MRDGNIVEQGDHESLLAKNGFYAELYRKMCIRDRHDALRAVAFAE